MIKIQLNDLEAEQHFFVVKDLIESRITDLIRIGSITRKRIVHYLDNNLRAYLNELLTNDTLKSLITARPDELIRIIASLKYQNANFFTPGHSSNLILRNIFITHCYDKNTFSKLDFIKRIEIDCCPYCNRNYIYYLSKSNEIKPQIDHFFPKSIYPFLGISFYNLIPSCQTCNGFGAKEEKDPFDEDLVNPYLLDKANFKFTYKIKSINFLNPLLDKTSVQLKYKNQIDGHISVFRLDKLYEQHTDHVLELIIKSKLRYSEKYREYLINAYPTLNLDSNDIDRLVLGNYSKEDEIHKRPLAKLYQDIGRELGIISST